jgi:4-hydroxythreonine-4-phosphate dehydrogenase
MPDPASLTATPALAITTGEPAGIGPDITIGALLQLAGNGHGAERNEAASAFMCLAMHACSWRVQRWAWPMPGSDARRGPCRGRGHRAWRGLRAGHLDARNGRYVLALLDAAIDGLLDGRLRP